MVNNVECSQARETIKRIEEEIPEENRQFLVIDVGTTNIKAKIYDIDCNVLVSKTQQTQVIRIGDRGSEINPEELWNSVVQICKECISETEESGKNIFSMGITTLRESFLIWNKDSLETFCNINTWQDRRGSEYVENLNQNTLFSLYRKSCAVKAYMGKNESNKLFSSFVFTPNSTAGRLGWLISSNSEITKAFNSNEAHFGTVESWLLLKLTGGKRYVSDIASASTTGMLDPINFTWHDRLIPFLGAKVSAFPEVIDTHGFLAITDASVFGTPIPITAIIGDQQASLYGCGCILPGNVKATFGTGIFINILTGSKIIPKMSEGCYPLIAWKHREDVNYTYESRWNFAVILLQRITDSKVLGKDMELNKIINDHFKGINWESEVDPSVTSKVIVETIENLAIKFYTIWKKFKQTCNTKIIDSLRIDGGISKIEYIVKCISSLIEMPVYVLKDPDATCKGACILSQLGAGIQRFHENLKRVNDGIVKCEPDDSLKTYLENKLLNLPKEELVDEFSHMKII